MFHRTLVGSNGTPSIACLSFCVQTERHFQKALGMGMFWKLALRLGNYRTKYERESSRIMFCILKQLYSDTMLSRGVEMAKRRLNHECFDVAARVASAALTMKNPSATQFFCHLEGNVFDALLGRPSPVSPAQAVEISSKFLSPGMKQLLALAQLVGHVVPAGCPSPSEILAENPCRTDLPSMYIHGFHMTRTGEAAQVEEGIRMLEKCKMPEAEMAVLTTSTRHGMPEAELERRLYVLIDMGHKPASLLYAKVFLSNASGSNQIVRAIKKLDELFPNGHDLRSRLVRRLSATRLRVKGAALRAEKKKEKALEKASAAEQRAQEKPSISNLARAAAFRQKAVVMEASAALEVQHTKDHACRVVVALDSLREAKSTAVKRARAEAYTNVKRSREEAAKK
jgi:hypothetical protein